jgi:hypothetical protein
MATMAASGQVIGVRQSIDEGSAPPGDQTARERQQDAKFRRS